MFLSGLVGRSFFPGAVITRPWHRSRSFKTCQARIAMPRMSRIGYMRTKSTTLQCVRSSPECGNREVGYWVGLRKPTYNDRLSLVSSRLMSAQLMTANDPVLTLEVRKTDRDIMPVETKHRDESRNAGGYTPRSPRSRPTKVLPSEHSETPPQF